jgi:uncharacterized membrane protein YedE/YeeE
MYVFFAFVAGLVFGIGLIVAQMINPAKIIGFLDLAGRWDPSLALVMGGAVAVGLAGFAVAGRLRTTLLGTAMLLPTNRTIDTQLVVGSLMFGAGWGLGGFCPGPGLVALGADNPKALAFVAAMIAGMLVFEGMERSRARVAPPAGDTVQGASR